METRTEIMLDSKETEALLNNALRYHNANSRHKPPGTMTSTRHAPDGGRLLSVSISIPPDENTGRISMRIQRIGLLEIWHHIEKRNLHDILPKLLAPFNLSETEEFDITEGVLSKENVTE